MPSQKDLDAILASGRRSLASKMKIPVLIAAALLLGVVWYWQRSPDQPLASLYVTESSRRADIVVTVTATGTVEPTNQVEVSSELSGTIRAVVVNDNDLVIKGQTLAQLDTDKLEARVEHGRATLASKNARVAEAEATLAEMSASYDRAKTLVDRGVTSREEFQHAMAAFERAKASLSIANADVRVSEADLRIDETDLSKACICSPIDGIVLDRNVEAGQIVASSLQAPVLFTIADDLTKMELQVDIDEADIGQVKVGNQATFTVEAYQNRSFPAEITELRYLPETINGVVTYKAFLSIDNEELLLRPGMTATAEVVVARVDDALVVANAALRFSPPTREKSESNGGSGLVGMLFSRARSTAPITAREAVAFDRKTLWILRGDEALAVEVRTGSTDGFVTEILEGDIAEDSLVITDLKA